MADYVGARLVAHGLLVLSLWGTESGAEPLFDGDEVLDVTLSGPLSQLIDNTESKDELPFTFSTDGANYEVNVRRRGNSRLRVCEFPPLRLNFRRSETSGSPFDEHNKLKLVTHCRNGDRGEQDMLEEYLAYRLFNVLTDLSYRVRLLKIRYADSDGQLDARASPRYAFVLEPDAQLAARLGGRQPGLLGVPKKRHDLEQAALMYVFQYMVGNTDWGLVLADYDEYCCHNVTLIEISDQIYTIPYDLDLTGIVNAQYARPDPELRIKNVRQRLYRGLCTSRQLLQSTMTAVLEKKAALLAMPRHVAGLTERNADRAVRYLEAFFERAEKPDKLMKRFEAQCIG